MAEEIEEKPKVHKFDDPTKLMLPVHTNGNLLCAIDTETTGLTPGFHDIIQIAIIPLNPDFTPNRHLLPFEMRMQPKRPENCSAGAFKVNKMSLSKAMRFGTDPWDAIDRFDEWFTSLKLPEKKKIIPLGHNYLSYDRLMIHDWLAGKSGWENYNHYFHHHVRDTMVAAIYVNDLAYWQQEVIPFQRVELGYLCTVLKVELMQAHDALADALASAECYRRLMKHLRAILPDAHLPRIGCNQDSMPEIPESIKQKLLASRTDESMTVPPLVNSGLSLDEEQMDYPA